MRGIILAGGNGTRLRPITLAINKQLIPIYNKPLIYYPLTTLMLAGIKEILIITQETYVKSFRNLLDDGSQLGIKLNYAIQDQANGIPEALIIGRNFIGKENIALILGDNFFYGSGMGRALKRDYGTKAKIFLKEVDNPSEYGVLQTDSLGNPELIVEKPPMSNSKLAVTGLYFYPNNVLDMATKLKPGKRGETEITDINNEFLRKSQLEIEVLPRSTVWFDTGTFAGIQSASEFVRVIEEQLKIRIGDPSEVARLYGWI
jgi:glucose-1-phosphate thymidylyltransferase